MEGHQRAYCIAATKGWGKKQRLEIRTREVEHSVNGLARNLKRLNKVVDRTFNVDHGILTGEQRHKAAWIVAQCVWLNGKLGEKREVASQKCGSTFALGRINKQQALIQQILDKVQPKISASDHRQLGRRPEAEYMAYRQSEQEAMEALFEGFPPPEDWKPFQIWLQPNLEHQASDSSVMYFFGSSVADGTEITVCHRNIRGSRNQPYARL